LADGRFRGATVAAMQRFFAKSADLALRILVYWKNFHAKSLKKSHSFSALLQCSNFFWTFANK
jgi:hypothetical protein